MCHRLFCLLLPKKRLFPRIRIIHSHINRTSLFCLCLLFVFLLHFLRFFVFWLILTKYLLLFVQNSLFPSFAFQIFPINLSFFLVTCLKQKMLGGKSQAFLLFYCIKVLRRAITSASLITPSLFISAQLRSI